MKSSLQVTIEVHQFSAVDIIGGDAALDFINTVTGRNGTPRDWLDGYPRLLEWSAMAHLLPETHRRKLLRQAQAEPAAAANALARAKLLREALFGLVTEMIADKVPPKGTLTLLREHWLAGVAAHELRFEDAQVAPHLRADAIELGLVAAMIAYRMVEQVLVLPVDRLRICQGPNCAWVFIDSSKAGRRRWCDMAVCGNAAKSRRFYAKTQQERQR